MNILSQIVLSLREIQSSEKSGEKLHYARCPFQFRQIKYMFLNMAVENSG